MRALTQNNAGVAEVMQRMIDQFGDMGVVKLAKVRTMTLNCPTSCTSRTFRPTSPRRCVRRGSPPDSYRRRRSGWRGRAGPVPNS